MAWQARMLARLQTADGRVTAYRYYFSHKPPIPKGMFCEQARNELGADHSSEIEYVFDNLYTRPYLWTDSDRKLAKLMSAYWVSFAKTGDPNGPGLPSWPACDLRHDLLTEFGDTPEPRRDFDKAGLLDRNVEARTAVVRAALSDLSFIGDDHSPAQGSHGSDQ